MNVKEDFPNRIWYESYCVPCFICINVEHYIPHGYVLLEVPRVVE